MAAPSTTLFILSTIPEATNETSTSDSTDERMADVDEMSVEEHIEIVAPLDEPMSVAEPASPMSVDASDTVAKVSPISCCSNEFKNGDASSFSRCAIM